MKIKKDKTFFTLCIFFFISKICISQVVLFEGHITTDTTWQSDTIKITNNVFIDSLVSLYINPGTYIEFQGHYKIEVKGSIQAQGIENDSIFFCIKDTTHFSDTSTVKGGWHGLRFLNAYDTSSFEYCSFSNGKSMVPGTQNWQSEVLGNKGGVIYAQDYSSISVTNSAFSNNFALNSGGGCYFNDVNTVFIIKCKFEKNQTLLYGGGIAALHCDNIKVEDNLFIRNKAFHIDQIGFAHGSGAAIYLSNPGYSNTCVYNNKCFNNKVVGGVIYESNKNHRITGNLICNNFGISIFNGHSASQGIYLNNTIANNNYLQHLSGLYCISSDLLIENNILWNNKTMLGDTTQIGYGPDCNPAVKFNNIQYGEQGEGNISQSPGFINPSPGVGLSYNGQSFNWSLTDSSPCVNRGNPDTSDLELPYLDVYSNIRFFGGRIDMGAAENQNIVSIQKSTFLKTKVYPNPGISSFSVNVIDPCRIIISDIGGKAIKEDNLTEGDNVIDMKSFDAGIYLFKITNKNKILTRGKWIKSN